MISAIQGIEMSDKIRFTAIAAVLVLAVAAVAKADCGTACGQGHGAYGYGAYGYFPSYVYVRDYIPYFALHPPVYYSMPVPRTYGYSPFAYPPGTRTPEIAEPEPLVVPNKFVPSKDRPEPEPDEVARKPLRITNPFMAASEGSTQAGGVAATP